MLDNESAAWLIFLDLRKHPSPPQHVVASKPLNRRANPIWSPLDCLNWTPRNPTAIIRRKQTNINIWTAKKTTKHRNKQHVLTNACNVIAVSDVVAKRTWLGYTLHDQFSIFRLPEQHHIQWCNSKLHSWPSMKESTVKRSAWSNLDSCLKQHGHPCGGCQVI